MSQKRKRRRGTRRPGSTVNRNASRYSGGEGGSPTLGGSWKPSNCTSRHRIAVVVPYRDRQQHLRIFLRHMHPFLQRQMLDYTIYIVEQVAYFLPSSLTNSSQYSHIAILVNCELLNSEILYFSFVKVTTF